VIYFPPKEEHTYFVDPMKKIKWVLKDQNLLVRGTPGAGDFMFTMSTAFHVSHLLKIPIHVIFYWSHDKDYVHHPEDPESIFEKIDYFYSRCYKKENITYEHVYEFKELPTLFNGEMFLNLEMNGRKEENHTLPYGISSWKMKQTMVDFPVQDNKIVIWKSNFNAKTPALWKRSYTQKDWEYVENKLKEKKYKVVNIDYRTPIREVFYHIQSSRFCMGYDGMWHYVARMLYKPTIITGDSGIIKAHNPQAKWFYNKTKDNKNVTGNLLTFIDNFDENKTILDNKLLQYKRKLEKILEN